MSAARTDATPARTEELLDSIRDIVMAEGFSSLRVGALARRLRCSRSTLYRLAPSKDELVLLVIARTSDESFAGATAAASAPGLTAPQRVSAHVRVSGHYIGMGSTTFWRDVVAYPAASAVLAEKIDRGIERISTYIEAGVASGECRPVHPAFVASIFWGAIRSATDPVVLSRAGLSTTEAMDEMAALMEHALEP